MEFLKRAGATAATVLVAATLLAQPAVAADKKLFVYVTPGQIGANAFLQLGKEGAEEAGKKLGADVKTFESTTAAARLDNVSAAIDEGADAVIAIGFEFTDVITQLAPTAPDTQFLLVDTCIDNAPANVHCVVFREYEAAYLMGVAAGMLTKAKHVGVIGAADIPFLHRFTDGYSQGVKSVDDKIQVDVRWVGGENPFADPVRAKEQAVALRSAGADVMYIAAGAGDFGVIEAAKEMDVKLLTVDINRCPEGGGYLVDSSLKRVDTAVITALEAVMAGKGQVSMSLGLKEGGMSAVALDPVKLPTSKCQIADYPDVVAKLNAVAKEISDGSLKLSDPAFAKP